MHRNALFAAALLLGLAAPTFAAVYDLAADFSTANNPNNVWSYGHRSAIADTAFTPFTQLNHNVAVTGSDDEWQSPSFQFLGVGKNTSGVNIDGGEGTMIPAGEAFMHPAIGEVSVSRFTAPSAGDYTVSTALSRFGGPSDGSSHFTLVLDGAAVYDETVSQPYTFQPTHTEHLTLAAGDTLDFVVDVGDGTDHHDSTGLRATVAVPEPASLAALALIAAPALLKRRSRSL